MPNSIPLESKALLEVIKVGSIVPGVIVLLVMVKSILKLFLVTWRSTITTVGR